MPQDRPAADFDLSWHTLDAGGGYSFGGNFDLDGFRHRAVYDGEEGRVIIDLVSQRAQRVRIQALDLEVVGGWSFPRSMTTGAVGEARQVVDSHVPLGALAALCRFRPDVIVSAELGARTAIAALLILLGSGRILCSFRMTISS